MDKEELKFYSIGRGSLNLNGKFYYGLDYAITDFMMDLEHKCKKQKEVIDKVNNHIKNKLQKSNAYEMGLKNSSYKDRLYSETYIELQVVLNILKEVLE